MIQNLNMSVFKLLYDQLLFKYTYQNASYHLKLKGLCISTDTQTSIHLKQNDSSTNDTVNLLDIKVAKYVTCQ